MHFHSVQRRRSVLLAASRPQSRKINQKPILQSCCYFQAALRAGWILQELKKHNLLILQYGSHEQTARPEALTSIARINRSEQRYFRKHRLQRWLTAGKERYLVTDYEQGRITDCDYRASTIHGTLLLSCVLILALTKGQPLFSSPFMSTKSTKMICICSKVKLKQIWVANDKSHFGVMRKESRSLGHCSQCKQ